MQFVRFWLAKYMVMFVSALNGFGWLKTLSGYDESFVFRCTSKCEGECKSMILTLWLTLSNAILMQNVSILKRIACFERHEWQCIQVTSWLRANAVTNDTSTVGYATFFAHRNIPIDPSRSERERSETKSYGTKW